MSVSPTDCELPFGGHEPNLSPLVPSTWHKELLRKCLLNQKHICHVKSSLDFLGAKSS